MLSEEERIERYGALLIERFATAASDVTAEEEQAAPFAAYRLQCLRQPSDEEPPPPPPGESRYTLLEQAQLEQQEYFEKWPQQLAGAAMQRRKVSCI